MQVNTLVIDSKDNVGVTIEKLSPSTALTFRDAAYDVRTTQEIPQFHKVALQDIEKGSPIIKYGEYIGVATEDIHAGDWVHVHNVVSTDAQKDEEEHYG